MSSMRAALARRALAAALNRQQQIVGQQCLDEF